MLFPDCNQASSLYNKIKNLILSVDKTLEETPRKPYVTFKLNKKNVISLWPYKGWIEVVLNAKLGTINDKNGLIYDISNRKWSSEQYAFKFYDDTDMDLYQEEKKDKIDGYDASYRFTKDGNNFKC